MWKERQLYLELTIYLADKTIVKWFVPPRLCDESKYFLSRSFKSSIDLGYTYSQDHL